MSEITAIKLSNFNNITINKNNIAKIQDKNDNVSYIDNDKTKLQNINKGNNAISVKFLTPTRYEVIEKVGAGTLLGAGAGAVASTGVVLTQLAKARTKNFFNPLIIGTSLGLTAGVHLDMKEKGTSSIQTLSMGVTGLFIGSFIAKPELVRNIYTGSAVTGATLGAIYLLSTKKK